MTQTLTSDGSARPGERRYAYLLICTGMAILLGCISGLWPGPVPVPLALSVSLTIFGAYVLHVARKADETDAPAVSAWAEWYDGDIDPVYFTDLSGNFLGENPSARAAGRLEDWLSDPGASMYRLTMEAGTNGAASEKSANGDRRISVVRAGEDMLLWRAERIVASLPGDESFAKIATPWIRLDADDRIVAHNPAAERLLDSATGLLNDLLADPPFEPGGIHVLAEQGMAVRMVQLAEVSGTRDFLMVPLDGTEISGLTPDRFLEDLPVALARLSPDGTLGYANRSARQLLGVDAAPGSNLASMIDGLGRSIPERLADTMRGLGIGRSEVARGRLDGHEIFLQVAFSRTFHEGEPAVMAVLSDATELKTLEAQFVQSQKMQAVGQLAGGVAHDFNNLLTAINGHCDLLLMRHDMADVEHGDLMQIRQNANRAAALVRQLLAFSRKQTLRPTVVNLQDTLAELSHLLNRLLSEKVTLTMKHGSDLAPVRVDQRQLEQVIMNLVVNARDAMPQGGEVKITSRNVHLDEDLHRDRAVVYKGDYVVIEVADSGTGIPEDKLNKIFEPFYTTKQVGEGTGLGLSTAYGIIKQTGGFIFASSPEGGGAAFTIYLPAYDHDEEEVVEEIEHKQTRDQTGRGMVLLVEDEDAVRSFAARALQLRGYTVIEAASGEEALEHLSDESLHVDVMLSDVIMPGLDGPAWVREAIKTRPDSKVIFMSGYTEDVFVGGDAGVPESTFLPKPFTLTELTERVKDAIEA